MFRNNELFVRWEKTMHQEDIEKFAFLYLCGQRDRDLLAGKERMTFEDFDRLSYITDFLGVRPDEFGDMESVFPAVQRAV